MNPGTAQMLNHRGWVCRPLPHEPPHRAVHPEAPRSALVTSGREEGDFDQRQAGAVAFPGRDPLGSSTALDGSHFVFSLLVELTFLLLAGLPRRSLGALPGPAETHS